MSGASESSLVYRWNSTRFWRALTCCLERAKLIWGTLTVWTAPGAGTEIELGIPDTHAYTALPRRLWIVENLSGIGRNSGRQRALQSDADSPD